MGAVGRGEDSSSKCDAGNEESMHVGGKQESGQGQNSLQ